MKTIGSMNGEIQIHELELPTIEADFVLVETEYSAISPGTEMTLSNMKNNKPIYLGYSAMGVVREVGTNVTHVEVGERVACYGAPYVRHAEKLLVPKNLIAPLSKQCDPREAAFAGIGAIAIHALRQADVRFGETIVVIGLGILGQIIAQIGNASGYRVVGCDLMQERRDLLQQSGSIHVCGDLAEVRSTVDKLTDGHGADAVLICAGGQSSGMVDEGLRLLRNNGAIVIVGDVKAECDRGLLFQKEARILISRAGGPGRYDIEYEQQGKDYPYSYVRWTEGRNVGEYVRLIEEKRIAVAPLITHEFALEDAPSAYVLYRSSPNEVLGALLRYDI